MLLCGGIVAQDVWLFVLRRVARNCTARIIRSARVQGHNARGGLFAYPVMIQFEGWLAFSLLTAAGCYNYFAFVSFANPSAEYRRL